MCIARTNGRVNFLFIFFHRLVSRFGIRGEIRDKFMYRTEYKMFKDIEWVVISHTLLRCN